MKNLAKRGGFIWVMLSIVPIAILVRVVGNLLYLRDNTIMVLQLMGLALQLYSFFMVIRYRKLIFNYENN